MKIKNRLLKKEKSSIEESNITAVYREITSWELEIPMRERLREIQTPPFEIIDYFYRISKHRWGSNSPRIAQNGGPVEPRGRTRVFGFLHMHHR